MSAIWARLEIRGPQALTLVQHVTCNDAARLADGQIQYSALTLPNGAFVDDILVHRFSTDHYFICVNASNARKGLLSGSGSNGAGFDAEVADRSADYSQLAIQGPLAAGLLGSD
jgi:aminomethyltransferase